MWHDCSDYKLGTATASTAAYPAPNTASHETVDPAANPTPNTASHETADPAANPTPNAASHETADPAADPAADTAADTASHDATDTAADTATVNPGLERRVSRVLHGGHRRRLQSVRRTADRVVLVDGRPVFWRGLQWSVVQQRRIHFHAAAHTDADFPHQRTVVPNLGPNASASGGHSGFAPEFVATN